MDFLYSSFSFGWKLTFIDFLRVAAAFVLAVPIGWKRNLGLRTFPIEATAACGYMLIAKNKN